MKSRHQKELTEIRKLGEEGQKIILISGNFNVVHAGHLRLMRFAKEYGDLLVVAVKSEKTAAIVLAAEMRLEAVQAIAVVDYAFLLDESPDIFIGELKPHAVVKGKEHEQAENIELKAVEAYGGKLLFGLGHINTSSIELLAKEFGDARFSIINKAEEYPRRHGFQIGDLKEALKKFRDLEVCVIGDMIVDDYINCDPLGMSQEDPTIVVSPISSNKFFGGAGIVAAHAQSLGATVHFLSVLGDDETAKYVTDGMDNLGVNHYFLEDDTRPTTLKQRYRVENKTLLRVSNLRQHEISSALMQRMIENFDSISHRIKLLIFSDFNYGCLPQTVVNVVSQICEKKGILFVADSQSSSQVGDVSRFKGAAFLTPTEREARLAMRDFNSGLVVLAESLRKKSEAKAVFVTLGADGVLIHTERTQHSKWFTDKLPAFNSAPKDVAGAGDSFLTTAALAYAAGYDIWQCAYMGSLAAFCQVSRVGNVPLQPDEIIREIEL